MTIRRATPDIRTEDMAASREFYRRLGFEEAMDLGWVVTMASPTNPTAQVLLLGPEAEQLRDPSGTIVNVVGHR